MTMNVFHAFKEASHLSIAITYICTLTAHERPMYIVHRLGGIVSALLLTCGVTYMYTSCACVNSRVGGYRKLMYNVLD